MPPTRYGPAHKAMRAAVRTLVDTGQAMCVRAADPRTGRIVGCGRPIHPGQRWDLGHAPGGGPDEWIGPQHASCNRAGGAITSNTQRAARRMRTSEAW